MKFSMNGFRRQLSEDCENLKQVVEQQMAGALFDEQDLIDAVNQIITHSNVINCVFDKERPECTDMSDIGVKHIKEGKTTFNATTKNIEYPYWH